MSLSVDMAELVKGIGTDKPASYTLVKASKRTPIERDDAVGFFYQALIAQPVGDNAFEAFVLTIHRGAKRKKVVTEGQQFIYLLKGRIDFLIGRKSARMKAGDALFFDGRQPHLPKVVGKANAVMLAIYLLGPRKQG